ncbi:hypothetical protein G6F56_005412 [Rhizopus delemar]|nr:hypothetical protein G6F56_005412 [Rhizopus delemar]
MDIAGFFGLCVWLVPFAYFISLSANDNALPISDSTFADTTNIPQQNKQGLLKTLFGYVGIKNQDTTMPISSTENHDSGFRPAPPTVGMTSSMNFQSPNRDIQNRKAL